eukprot:221557_1
MEALKWALFLKNSINLITFILIAPFLVRYFFVLIQNKPEKEVNQSILIKITYHVSVGGICCFMISSVSFIVLYIVWFIMYSSTTQENPLFINLWDVFNILLYVIGIWTMLFTFVLRIHDAFREFHSFPSWLMYFLYGYIIIIGITLLAMVILLGVDHAESIQIVAPLCVFEIITCNVILLYILFRKLFTIFVTRGSQSPPNHTTAAPIITLNALETVTIYCTLVLVAVLSTFIVMSLLAIAANVSVFVPGGTIIGCDMFVNATCLYLMFGMNHETYNEYCTAYHSCLQSCCVDCTYKGD